MRIVSRSRLSAITLLCLALSPSATLADGLDSGYFIRFDSLDHSWTYICMMLALIMVANYLLNFAVIGVPTIWLASVQAKTVAIGLAVLTVLGQVADRVGSIVGIFLAVPIAAIVSPFVSSTRRGLDGVFG